MVEYPCRTQLAAMDSYQVLTSMLIQPDKQIPEEASSLNLDPEFRADEMEQA